MYLYVRDSFNTIQSEKTMNAKRDFAKHPHFVCDRYLYNWTNRNLPDKKLFFVTDIDMVLRNREGDLMLVEVKRQKAEPSPSQRRTLKVLDRLIKDGLRFNNGEISIDGHEMPINYHGLHLLQFERSTFEDGKVFFDREEVSEEKLVSILKLS